MAHALLRIFVVSFILLNYANCDEPKCSKFSFEESLLEKMVRIEFEVEKFSKGLKEKYEEIDRIKTTAKEELQQLQHDREVWKAEIERLKIDSIETIKNKTDLSLVYIRWGRTVCPGDSTLIYHGYAAGSHNTNKGGVGETQCLPSDPQWGNVDLEQSGSYIYGAEYETGSDRSNRLFGKNIHDHDVPCAVCEVKGRYTLHMFPARTSCYDGWHLEYHGYMMTSQHTQHRSNVKCMDSNPETITGQEGSSDGDLFYFIVAYGQLPNPPYIRGYELTCAVCTK